MPYENPNPTVQNPERIPQPAGQEMPEVVPAARPEPSEAIAPPADPAAGAFAQPEALPAVSSPGGVSAQEMEDQQAETAAEAVEAAYNNLEEAALQQTAATVWQAGPDEE